MSLCVLPLDVWFHVPLSRRDSGSLAATCRYLRQAMIRVACVRGVRVYQDGAQHIVDAWAPVRRVEVYGVPLRLGILPAPRVPRTLKTFGHASLEDLELRHVHLCAGSDFWGAVFGACPRLRRVKVMHDFFLRNYAADVKQYTDLVRLGAPRLQSLDVEGGWLVMYPTPIPTEYGDIAAEAERTLQIRPVPSTTLTEYRVACRQAPVGVDAPLRSLVIEETHQPPLVVCRMGPLTYESTTRLVWKCGRQVFDPSLLRRFVSLASLDLDISSTPTPQSVSACLDMLDMLPPTLRSLRLRFDMWSMRAGDTDIEWGRPLAHLHALEHLHVHMLFAPDTAEDLLGTWLGAPSLRVASATFDESPGTGFEALWNDLIHEGADPDDDTMAELRDRWMQACEPFRPTPLYNWLARNPRATVRIRGLEPFTCPHPRVTLVTT